MTAFIAYLRVSTQKQGDSGLGLEAQAAAIAAHAGPARVLATFTEVESGKRSDRPALKAALDKCRQTGATLLVAKLDRLGRNVAFIAALMESGVDFVACDLPHANKLTLHILAAVAQAEAEAISARTKSALAAAKARGTKLGGYRGTPPTKAASRKGHASLRAFADERAHTIAPVLTELRASGVNTYDGLARALTDRGILAPRGNTWSAVQVSRYERRVCAPLS